MTKLSHADKLILKRNLMRMPKSDWEFICKCILLPNKESLTITKGGVFFCLMNISDKSVMEIQKFVSDKRIKPT